MPLMPTLGFSKNRYCDTVFCIFCHLLLGEEDAKKLMLSIADQKMANGSAGKAAVS